MYKDRFGKKRYTSMDTKSEDLIVNSYKIYANSLESMNDLKLDFKAIYNSVKAKYGKEAMHELMGKLISKYGRPPKTDIKDMFNRIEGFRYGADHHKSFMKFNDEIETLKHTGLDIKQAYFLLKNIPYPVNLIKIIFNKVMIENKDRPTNENIRATVKYFKTYVGDPASEWVSIDFNNPLSDLKMTRDNYESMNINETLWLSNLYRKYVQSWGNADAINKIGINYNNVYKWLGCIYSKQLMEQLSTDLISKYGYLPYTNEEDMFNRIKDRRYGTTSYVHFGKFKDELKILKQTGLEDKQAYLLLENINNTAEMIKKFFDGEMSKKSKFLDREYVIREVVEFMIERYGKPIADPNTDSNTDLYYKKLMIVRYGEATPENKTTVINEISKLRKLGLSNGEAESVLLKVHHGIDSIEKMLMDQYDKGITISDSIENIIMKYDLETNYNLDLYSDTLRLYHMITACSRRYSKLDFDTGYLEFKKEFALLINFDLTTKQAYMFLYYFNQMEAKEIEVDIFREYNSKNNVTHKSIGEIAEVKLKQRIIKSKGNPHYEAALDLILTARKASRHSYIELRT